MFEIPEALRQKYLQRRHQDVEDCAQKLQSSDWAYFAQLGHQLKGNAPSYGYDDLAVIAERIETHAKERNTEALNAVIQEFEDWAQKNSAHHS